MKLTARQKAAFGIGAVGKDMVYALSSSYIMYYYQDILGLSASFVGLILMIARIFDAINDPFMGILVAKTRTRWGKFRPWLVSGTVLNAFVLYAMFAAPDIKGTALMVFFSVIYILWGVTYTMMDIPYWSMIPAITSTPADTENLSVIGRTCAGVGSALIAMGTMLLVGIFGGNSERAGFRMVALIVAVIFVVAELICAFSVREREDSSMETASVSQMFKALFSNDQALVVVLSIVLINSALYLTSNLIIYFFKYDFGGADWKVNYTLFSTVGGACQILGMMIVYPLLRKKLQNTQIVIGATNRLDIIDSALLRRFSRVHELTAPQDEIEASRVIKLLLDDCGIEYDRDELIGFCANNPGKSQSWLIGETVDRIASAIAHEQMQAERQEVDFSSTSINLVGMFSSQEVRR